MSQLHLIGIQTQCIFYSDEEVDDNDSQILYLRTSFFSFKLYHFFPSTSSYFYISTPIKMNALSFEANVTNILCDRMGHKSRFRVQELFECEKSREICVKDKIEFSFFFLSYTRKT